MPRPQITKGVLSTRGEQQQISFYHIWACVATIGFLWSISRRGNEVQLAGSVLTVVGEDVPKAPSEVAVAAQQSAADRPCSRYGTTQLSATTANGNIVLDKTAIRNHSKQRIENVLRFTHPDYEQFMKGNPGGEHYVLLQYLTETYHAADDCRHVVDIGTRFVSSALALGATGVKVKTFDIPNSSERVQAFRGKSEQDWQNELKSGPGVNIEFIRLDLLSIPIEEFQEYFATWLISLDTFHEPYTVPFEREFLNRLINVPEPHKFKGIMLLDDIHLNPEMTKWWQEVQDNAKQWGYTAHDVTSIGHATGTGLLDFSGKVAIVE